MSSPHPTLRLRGPTWLLTLALVALAACAERQKAPNPDVQATHHGEKPSPMSSVKASQRPLTREEERVIVHKGTERPFSGRFADHHENGTYTCRRCGTPLFESSTKFDSRSGWPSFDDAIQGAVKEVPDADGMRTEIVCARCEAHLGHVFRGEGFTDKGTRHCVNSVSLDFAEDASASATSGVAYFAGGCFWGVEYLLEKLPGVLDVESGYMGGEEPSPTYEQVSAKRTGHAETVKVVYDPSRISYDTLARAFFEIHDPTQVNRQGPDVGPQYRSAVFVTSDAERETVRRLIRELEAKGLRVATDVQSAGKFWPAEDYHQDYYSRTGKEPYCHARVSRF